MTVWYCQGIRYQTQLIKGLGGSARGYSVQRPADNRTVLYYQAHAADNESVILAEGIQYQVTPIVTAISLGQLLDENNGQLLIGRLW